jgi:3D (Asp-Asp-Asp) domain-containing protein
MRVCSLHFSAAVLSLMLLSAVPAGARDAVQLHLQAIHNSDNQPVSSELVQDVSAVAPEKLSVMDAKQLWMEVTAYCPCTRCCGPTAVGVTASGLPVTHNDGHFVAADTRMLPFGTQVRIPGYGQDRAVPVIDTGSAIKGHKLDVYFASHTDALQWGRRWVLVTIAANAE